MSDNDAQARALLIEALAERDAERACYTALARVAQRVIDAWSLELAAIPAPLTNALVELDKLLSEQGIGNE